MRPREWWGGELLDHWSDTDEWMLHGDRVLRGADLRVGVQAQAERFGRAGIRAGDVVALQAPPGPELVLVLLGLWSVGACVALLDIRLKKPETEALLALCAPAFVVHGDDHAIARRAGGGRRTDEVCLIQFSSGSTGRPKVVGRDPASLLAELGRYRATPGMWGRGERVLVLCSTVHTWGLVGGVLHGLSSRCSLVLPHSLAPTDLGRLVVDAGVAVILGVPAHFDLLGLAAPPAPAPVLRLAVSAGEVLGDEVHDRFVRSYGLPVAQVYGMTEVGLIAADLAATQRPPAVGWPASGLRVEVLEDEIVVGMDRSPYLVDDGLRRFADGWLHTFDRGAVDPASGSLVVLGRIDSLAVVGGLKVDLTEVETVLRDHPAVREAVVLKTDVIEAHVGVDTAVDVAALNGWCRDRLSDHKVPKRFVVVPELARSANGKVIRDPARMRP